MPERAEPGQLARPVTNIPSIGRGTAAASPDSSTVFQGAVLACLRSSLPCPDPLLRGRWSRAYRRLYNELRQPLFQQDGDPSQKIIHKVGSQFRRCGCLRYQKWNIRRCGAKRGRPRFLSSFPRCGSALANQTSSCPRRHPCRPSRPRVQQAGQHMVVSTDRAGARGQ